MSWRERAFSVSFWTEHGLEKEAILDGLRAEVAARKYFAVVDEGWSTWDLEVQGGLWSRRRVTVATEYHGGAQRVLRVKTALRASLVTRVASRSPFSPPSSARSFASRRSSRSERRASCSPPSPSRVRA